MKNTVISALLVAIIAGLLNFGVSQQPAAAVIYDRNVIGRLQQRKNDLLNRQYQLLRDTDDLNRQLDDLKRSDDPNARFLINDTAFRLNSTYNDLQKTRWELKQVENSLL